MQGVAGVVTTGIYCRPGCSAQPLARNVRRFPTAAAAEAAGFRACLRCRPYRLPPTAGVTGPELVCRAVRLVLAGALDDGTEALLADRLGVSARHLRRQFITHIGVTPDGLARSARAHFARRLLDETDLTITEVAFAVGFGSVRQFNRVCREVFRASPSELRAKRRRADRLAADGGLALRLAFDGPLDWAAMLACLAREAIPGVEYVAGDVYRRTVLIGGDPGLLELGPGGEDHLILRAHLPHWEELVHVVRGARQIANLDADGRAPPLGLAADPIVGPLVRARPGVRVPGTWDGFEVGIRTLVEQDTKPGAASAVLERIVTRFGRPVPGLQQLGLSHSFPTPATLAEAELTGIGVARSTAVALRGFARATADGTIRLERGAALGRLVDSISALPGVGQLVGHAVGFRLGEPDAFPLSQRELARRLRFRGDPAPRSDAEIIERWRPWRAVAATHLLLTGGVAPTARKGAA